jgi:sulfatase modifying factor 1
MKPVAIAVGMLVAAIFLAGCSFWEDLPAEEEQETDTTVTLEHSGGMVLVKAKDSSFEMGSNENDQGSVTQPVHKVSFTYDFWMDTTEVTQGNYDSIMTAFCPGYLDSVWDVVAGAGSTYPAFNRNWYDAALYCNARSKRETLDTVYYFDSIAGTPGSGCSLKISAINMSRSGYRLPTEAEWEYACRAGTSDEFYWGQADSREYAWYTMNSSSRTNPVAKRKPNRYGLYDMSGNVAEWCNDWYAAYDDQDAVDPTGPSSGNYRIQRGGCWANEVELISSSTRVIGQSIERNSGVGFRVVKIKK